MEVREISWTFGRELDQGFLFRWAVMTKTGKEGEGVGRVLWPFLLNSPEFLSRKDWRLVLKLHLQSKFTFP